MMTRLCFAEHESIEERLKQLETRMEIMEKKLINRDRYIREQQVCIEVQNKKIDEYESKFTPPDLGDF